MKNRKQKILAALTAVVLGTGAASADVVYQELFTYDTIGTLPETGGTYGWRWAGWDGVFRNGGNSGQDTVANTSGALVPSGGSVNSNPQAADSTTGWVYTGNGNNTGEILFQEEYDLSLSDIDNMVFSWNHKNSVNGEKYRALIAVAPTSLADGWAYADVSWYVTQSATTTDNNSGNWNGSIAFDLGASSWFDANVNNVPANGTVGISVGSAATLPGSGVIVGSGIYMEDKQGAHRIDNFSVVIPEPATLGLVSGAFALMVFIRRRLLI